jgi:hypothetical protein
MKTTARLLTVIMLLGASVRADEAADRAYIQRFEKKYPPIANPPTLAEYANPQRFEKLYLGDKLDRSLAKLNNNGGAMAWGLSYRMLALNEMARATSDPKYLEAQLRCIRAALAARDERTGTKLFDGRVVPAWSSDGYRKGEQALFMVHTGMIVYPMLDAVDLARQLPGVSDDLRRDLEATAAQSIESLACHDDAWRDGPGDGEGHYVMLREEPSSEGKPQPGNRLAAMGRALYSAYRVTGDEKYLQRARALAHYIKRRLPVAANGAYLWSYWLPLKPVTTPPPGLAPEDTSHGSLTMSFPALLASHGEVFTADDMKRFGQTVTHGVGRLGKGVLLGDVGGMPASSPERLGHPANWLQLAPHAPEVRDAIVPFYLRYKPEPMPSEMAYLIRFGAPAE